jgi:hypothetical protein
VVPSPQIRPLALAVKLLYLVLGALRHESITT